MKSKNCEVISMEAVILAMATFSEVVALTSEVAVFLMM